jgi:hypothetical protein
MIKTITIDGTKHEALIDEYTSNFTGEYVVTVHDGNQVSQKTFTENDVANDQGNHAFYEVFGFICEYIASCFRQIADHDDDFNYAMSEFIEDNDIRFAVCYDKYTVRLIIETDEIKDLVFDTSVTRLEDYIRVELDIN